MNIGIICIEVVIMTMYFTITLFDLTRKYKNHPAMINNYPKDIQEEYLPIFILTFRRFGVILTTTIILLILFRLLIRRKIRCLVYRF